ncbi:uncharacterized protein LOC122939800 isoform X1 [Bufo gargarizans]|uniref:uncharacterized protein LOC122939800 isoform X1 n=1 Tax=Bufo gargarizans TaxID=30331 RepID=UPI001CF142DE|nr:uncharacterized protein LOC122939800 isoform X1 [Bufo gargarizans]XP_044151885.1 uncharacterized protein LOC122939800 isoform X1 [Bufo gargarizans]
MDSTDCKQGHTIQPQDPQGGVQIHMQDEDGEIMCVKIKEEEIPAEISPHGSSGRDTPERRLRFRYSHALKPDKDVKEEALNIVLVNADSAIDGDSSYLDKEEEIPIDFSPVPSEHLGTHLQVVKNRTSSNGRASTFTHTRKRQPSTRMTDSRGYIEVNSLITAVSHQPAIWDARDPSYMDRLKRSHAWERVCQEMTEDWDDFHAKTKDRRLKDLQTRWRSLKDCYRRELQQQRKAEKSGGPTVKRKTYLYFRQLQFLKPVLEARRQVWKQKSSDCPSGNLREKTEESKLDITSSATSAIPRAGATSSLPLMESSLLKQPLKRRRQQKQSNFTQNSPVTSQGVVREYQEQEKDADYHFYMYIMAVTKKFSPEKKWAFRMKIMELLQMHSLDQQAPSSFSPHLTYSYTPEAHISPSANPPSYPHYYPYEASHSSRHSPTPIYIPSNYQHNSLDLSILPGAPSQPQSPTESPYRSPLSRSSQTPSSQASLDTEGDSSFLDY